MTTQLTIDASGYIQNRRIARDESLIVATEIIAGQQEVRPHVPESHAGAFEELVRDMTQRSNELDAIVRQLRPPPPSRQIEPTPELLAFEPLDTLNNLGLLNRGLDSRASSISDIVKAGLKRPKGTAKHEAAVKLKDHFFTEGLNFTRTDFEHQWLEFGRRFDDVPAPVLAAATLLACDDLVVEAKALNTHFGRLLGLTERSQVTTDATPEAVRVAHNALVSTLMRALALSFAIWPEPDFTDANHRKRFVGPFLNALLD